MDLACWRIRGREGGVSAAGVGRGNGELRERDWLGVGQIRVFWTNRNLTFCGREITNHGIEF